MKKLEFKGDTAEIINYTFQAWLISYLILLLIEQIWNGSVSMYFNLNYLLIIVILSGILDVFSDHNEPKKAKPKWWDYLFISLLGILGFIIIKFKTGELGWLSWLISVIAGTLIILLSLLVLEEDEEENKKIKQKAHQKISRNKPSLWVFSILAIIFTLNLISLGITIFTALSYLESLRIIFGSIYVLFLPGFIISYLFFPKTRPFEDNEKENGAIDYIERIALSFALSIAIVPLAVFYLNLIGIKINLLNSSLIILGIILISLGILYYKNRKRDSSTFLEILSNGI